MRLKKILLTLLCFSCSLWAQAQNWGGGVDEESFNWGFQFQYVSVYNVIKPSATFSSTLNPDLNGNGGQLRSVQSIASPGFALGAVVNYKLADHLDLRLIPSFTLSQRSLVYGFQDSNDLYPLTSIQKETAANLVEVPLNLKLKSERVGNYRFYLVGGLKYAMNVSSSDRYDNNQVMDEMGKYVNYKRKYLAYDAGLGVDFYLNYFKMSAELKHSRSFGNILMPENHTFSNALDKVYVRHFSLSLFFENLL